MTYLPQGIIDARDAYQALGFDDRYPIDLGVPRTVDQARLHRWECLQRAREAIRSEFPDAWLQYVSAFPTGSSHREPLSPLVPYLRPTEPVGGRGLDNAIFTAYANPTSSLDAAFEVPNALHVLLHTATQFPDWFLACYRNRFLAIPRQKSDGLTIRLLSIWTPFPNNNPAYLEAMDTL